jgi:hypothetical protein
MTIAKPKISSSDEICHEATEEEHWIAYMSNLKNVYEA